MSARYWVSAVALGALAALEPSASHAQGLSLIENCPVDIAPLERALPVRGEHKYNVTARFIVDVNGAVLAPSVQRSTLLMKGSLVPVPQTLDRAFLDALKKWRYARRAKPCLSSVALELTVAL